MKRGVAAGCVDASLEKSDRIGVPGGCVWLHKRKVHEVRQLSLRLQQRSEGFQRMGGCQEIMQCPIKAERAPIAFRTFDGGNERFRRRQNPRNQTIR
jgi:hypothetical protein